MLNLPVEMIVGNSLADMQSQPLPPYSNEAIEFLSDLSKALLSMPDVRDYTDVAAFGYWCRRAHLSKLSENFDKTRENGSWTSFPCSPS